jgi:hypothetical protein
MAQKQKKEEEEENMETGLEHNKRRLKGQGRMVVIILSYYHRKRAAIPIKQSSTL